MTFNTVIGRICLPTDENQVPQNLTISGFGKTEAGGNFAIKWFFGYFYWKIWIFFPARSNSNYLLKGTVERFSSDECQKIYTEFSILDRQYCAKGLVGTRVDACQGDSGGPLSYKQGKDSQKKKSFSEILLYLYDY